MAEAFIPAFSDRILEIRDPFGEVNEDAGIILAAYMCFPEDKATRDQLIYHAQVTQVYNKTVDTEDAPETILAVEKGLLSDYRRAVEFFVKNKKETDRRKALGVKAGQLAFMHVVMNDLYDYLKAETALITTSNRPSQSNLFKVMQKASEKNGIKAAANKKYYRQAWGEFSSVCHFWFADMCIEELENRDPEWSNIPYAEKMRVFLIFAKGIYNTIPLYKPHGMKGSSLLPQDAMYWVQDEVDASIPHMPIEPTKHSADNKVLSNMYFSLFR